MRWITGLLGGLWRFSRASWVDVGEGLRPGSGASALYLFLFLVFFLVGAVLVLMGVSLDSADRWLDAQADWLDTLGSIVLRLVFALVLAVCALAVVAGLYQRLPGRGHTAPPTARTRGRRDRQADTSDRVGWGVMLFALILGYFAVIGAFGRY